MKTLIIGGARSGKSALAARLAQERRAQAVCCILTAIASDAEMTARIAVHRRARPSQWSVREEPVHLATALREAAPSGRLLLIDCLTLWTANCLWPRHSTRAKSSSARKASDTRAYKMVDFAETPGESADIPPDLEFWQRARTDFADALRQSRSDVILVINEIGSGIVPLTAAARIFRDEHGRLAQEIAAICSEVLLVVAGIALPLKSKTQTDGARHSSRRDRRAAPSRSPPRQRPGSHR